MCRAPVTTAAQQAALVADVYQKWAVGATAQEAQDAAMLFENVGNPGNPQVQAILKNLVADQPVRLPISEAPAVAAWHGSGGSARPTESWKKVTL